MDPGVSPRVTYWTGIWDPGREALSSEVEVLRRSTGRHSPVVSFSAGQRSSVFVRDRVVCLSGVRWVVLRALAAGLERTGDLTHVFGEISAWHLLRAVGRRPILFTVAIPGPPLDRALYEKVSLFAAETEPLAESLRLGGIDPGRIRVVPPGVDLDRFRPTTIPRGSPRVLFASSPASPADFAHRGIPQLIEAARICREVEFILLWRQWGQLDDVGRALRDLNPPPNVTVEHRDVPDMASVFQDVHATVFLSAPGHGKSCPNSVIEGLACGRPTVVSESCGIAAVVAGAGAGLASSREPEAVARAIRSVLSQPEPWRLRARDVAEQHFSLANFTRTYTSLYETLAANRKYIASSRDRKR